MNYNFSTLFFRQALSVFGHYTEFWGLAQGDGSPPLHGPLSVIHQFTDETAGVESEVLFLCKTPRHFILYVLDRTAFCENLYADILENYVVLL